jgi:uncharacterized protein (TIGR03085 family)
MSVNHAQHERAGLCELFERVGPDVSTLCDGWTTRDLAAHLVVRERRPDAALGIVAAPFARHGERVRLQEASRPWPSLVSRVRNGPPRWSPFSLAPIDRAANTVEYFVHHEDVRRALPDWQPRHLDPALDAVLWATVARMGRLLVRRAPCGVVLRTPGSDGAAGSDAAGGEVTARKGSPSVEVVGTPGELVLFVYGRQEHARVELVGPAASCDALRSASFGI